MVLCRLIAPKWLHDTGAKAVHEGLFSPDELAAFNKQGYNVYTFPNYPSEYAGGNVKGEDINTFAWCFVDCDLKDKKYTSKQDFIAKLASVPDLAPTKVVDSGNGVHAYWKIQDLDAKSYLRFQRRLMRVFDTDPAVASLVQLMRLPGYLNQKEKLNPKPCAVIYESDISYTCEELDRALPSITLEDETYCQNHYNRIYDLEEPIPITGNLPPSFGALLRKNKEAVELFAGTTDYRSKSDYRLGHIMFAHSFSKEDAMNVIYNGAKATSRSPAHRYNYAKNIIDAIWTYEDTKDKEQASISQTVRQILSKGDDVLKGTRFPCNQILDDTKHGFRLGQVLGIIGGSGVGKTTLTLNCFLWFAENNPAYDHIFFSLEQPAGEIAHRIKTICGKSEALYDKIHVISNYNDDGTYNHFSLSSIEDNIKATELQTKRKIGAVVVDHIGVLSKDTKNGETDGLIGICRQMKSTAVRLNVMLLMLSQAPREKAGIGDLELNKDAAFGTVFFESFTDYCLCLWQPLKRAYTQGAPTIMSFKFAKIRHKNQKYDRIKEDVCYQLFFDPETERLRELTQDEETSAKFFVNVATNLRKRDRKTDIVAYVSRKVNEETNAPKDAKDSSRH